jgi:1-acyl-sn-glycerol-3-phosphate acyltransferase
MIRTIIAVLYFALALLLIMPWLILWTVLTGKPDFMYHTAVAAVRFGVRIVGIRVHVEGVKNIPSGVCIFAANHISNVDPLAFVAAIPRRVSLLAKKEVFRIPILGFALRLAKMIPVDREDREAAAASVDLAVRYLTEGLSFAIYPEGTRSPDGRLRPFKKGAFAMAIRAGVAIVPVSIVGAQKLMRKGNWTLHPGKIIVRFHPPVEASKYPIERRGELRTRVESVVASGLPEDQQPLAAPAAQRS